MDSLAAFEQEVTSLFSKLPMIVQKIDLPRVCLLSDEATISTLSYPGIYRIDIATDDGGGDLESWLNTFKGEWEPPDKFRSTPKTQKRRMNAHKELLEWMPLYLGKAKNIARRVNEHINLESEKSTFALKLNGRKAMTNRSFRLHVLRLGEESYDLLAPPLEATLRNLYNPVVGKQ